MKELNWAMCWPLGVRNTSFGLPIRTFQGRPFPAGQADKKGYEDSE